MSAEDDQAAVELMPHRRYLIGVAYRMLGSVAEAEDVVQAAYVSAFSRLASFRRESSLGTWLSRIVINEVLGRRRRHHPTVELTTVMEADVAEADIIPFPLAAAGPDPAPGLDNCRA